MIARLILEDKPGAYLTFTSRGRKYRARRDPMWLGPDLLPSLLTKTRLVWQLLDDDSKMQAMTNDPFGSLTVVLLSDYLDAAGLNFDGLARLRHAMENLEDLEVDLLRLGFDVRDWLDPEGPLSSRRVALLVRDFLDRPETRMGATSQKLLPVSKETIVLAQIASGMGGEGFTHDFLKSPEEIAQEAKALAEVKEKRERISKQAPAQLDAVSSSGKSFRAVREESRKQLQKILAGQATT